MRMPEISFDAIFHIGHRAVSVFDRSTVVSCRVLVAPESQITVICADVAASTCGLLIAVQ